jgi:hypothetical protein
MGLAIVYGLDSQGIWVWFPSGARHLSLLHSTYTALPQLILLSQWILSLWIKLKLATHLHLMPKWRMGWVTFSIPRRTDYEITSYSLLSGNLIQWASIWGILTPWIHGNILRNCLSWTSNDPLTQIEMLACQKQVQSSCYQDIITLIINKIFNHNFALFFVWYYCLMHNFGCKLFNLFWA